MGAAGSTGTLMKDKAGKPQGNESEKGKNQNTNKGKPETQDTNKGKKTEKETEKERIKWRWFRVPVEK